nr:hypothetical protein [Tanacetum cinerariifolium]
QDEDKHEPMFIQPHDPDFVPEPIYPEYIPLKDEHILLAEEQPLPLVVLPTAESPGYVVELDPEEDPEEYEDDETEDGLVDYPMDEGDDGDDDDGDSSGYDVDDDDEDEDEEEEHLALADSAVVIPTDELVSPPEGTEPVIPPPSTDTATTGARITIRPQTSISLPPEAEVERLLAMPTPSPSPSPIFYFSAIMSHTSSAVTYTSVYTNSEPGRVFWGANKELSDGGPPRVIVYGYDGLSMLPVALPSPDYIPGIGEPRTPPIPQDEDKHEPMFIQPHDPDFVPEPIYPEYIPLKDEHILLAEEQPLPLVVLPTAESPGYVVELDPEEDPEEYEDDETEDGLVDYPMDEGDDGDDDDGDSSGYDVDDDDEDEDEEEEHLALADSAVVIPTDELVSPPEGTEPVIRPPSTDTATTGARITIRPQTSISLPPEAEVQSKA